MSLEPYKFTYTHGDAKVTTTRLDCEYHELAELTRLAGIHAQGNTDWLGGLDTTEKVVEVLVKGSDYQLEQSKKLLEQIQDKLDLAGVIRETSLCVVGSLPCVPAYLAGSPMNMRRTSDSDSEHNATPCRIFVGLASSGCIDAEDLATRGAAILAFAQALSISRPVELLGISATSVSHQFETAITIRIGLAPVDLSALCALSHPGVQRGAIYGIEEAYIAKKGHGNTLAWPKSEAKAVGCEPGDVFFKSPHADDMAEITKDPIKWVQNQLEKAISGDGTAYTGERNS